MRPAVRHEEEGNEATGQGPKDCQVQARFEIYKSPTGQ